MRPALVAAIVILALAAPGLAEDGERTATARYQTTYGLTLACGTEHGNLGGACFGVSDDDRAVTLHVQDDRYTHVAASYRIVGLAGTVDEGKLCDFTHLIIPEDQAVTGLRVKILGPLEGSKVCHEGLALSSQGTITATFSTSTEETQGTTS